MFDFYGRTGRREFLIGLTLRFALLLLFTVGYPFVHRAILSTTGCNDQSCGAIGLVTAMMVKPNAVLLIFLSFIGILMRRARDAGLPPWIGLVVVLLAVPDTLYLIVFGGPWTLAFVAGVIGQPTILWGLLIPVWLIAVLAALPSRPTRDWRVEPPRALEIAAGIALAHLAIVALVRLSYSTPIAAIILASHWRLLLFYPLMVSRFVAVATSAALLWQGLRTDDPPPVAKAVDLPSDGDAARLVPVGRIVAAALVIASLEWALSQPGALDQLLFAIQLPTAIVPTAAIDALLFVAVVLTVTRRTPAATVLLAVALVPFGAWGWETWKEHRIRAEEAAEIASIPTIEVRTHPDTLVIEMPERYYSGPYTLPGIKNLFTRSPKGDLQAQRNTVGIAVESPLPPDHLVFRVREQSAFFSRQPKWDRLWGPFELRLKTATSDDLVAIDYARLRSHPPILPVLTTGGWLVTNNANASTKEQTNAEFRFLATALAKMPARD